MKKQTAAMLGVCGLASSAFGQNFNLWLEPSGMSPEGTFTVSVYGDSDLGGVYVSGVMGLQVSTLSGQGRVSNISWDFDLVGNYLQLDEVGYLGDGMHGEVGYAWFVGCGIFPCETTDLGAPIGHFTIVVDPDAFETYQIDLIAGPDLNPAYPYTIEVADPLGNLYNDSQGSLTLTGATVSVVPSPGLVSIMTMCAMLSSRRIRRKED